MYYPVWMVVLAVLAPVLILGLLLVLDRLEETLTAAPIEEPSPTTTPTPLSVAESGPRAA